MRSAILWWWIKHLHNSLSHKKNKSTYTTNRLQLSFIIFVYKTQKITNNMNGRQDIRMKTNVLLPVHSFLWNKYNKMHEIEMKNYLIDHNYMYSHFFLFITREIAKKNGIIALCCSCHVFLKSISLIKCFSL